MSKTPNEATLDGLTDAMSGAACEALARHLGVPVQATESGIVASVDESLLENASVSRTTFTGAPEPVSLVTVLVGDGLIDSDGAFVDSAILFDVMAEGIVDALSEIVGVRLSAEPSQALPDGPAMSELGARIVRAEIAGEPNGSLTAFWVVEAALETLLVGGAPVAPPVSEGPTVAPATLPELSGTGSASAAVGRDLEILADVAMNVTVELGRTAMQVRDLLALRDGSIIALDRDADSAVDVLVNGTLVAHGDVVVVDDELGIRITEVVARS